MIIHGRGYSFIAPAFKLEWSKLCFELANLSNSIAMQTPYFDVETKSVVNQELQIPTEYEDHVWKVPNIIHTGSLLVLSSNLNSIANIVRGEYFLPPNLIAPQARIMLEITSLLNFLSCSDAPLRTARALDTLSKKMTTDTARTSPILEQQYSAYAGFANRYKTCNPGVKVSTGGYREFVGKQLPELDEGTLYSTLCAYTHHNAYIAFEYMVKPVSNPTSMEAEALDYVGIAVKCAIKSAFMTLEHRDPNERLEPYLESRTDH